MEMYLETIYKLENSHGHAHGVDIANHLGVSKPSVTKAVNILKSKGLVNQETYGSITLTAKGRQISEEIYKKHRMIAQFLEHSLGLSHEEANKNACRIEHVLSDEMFKAIKQYLERVNNNENND
ncbi:MAG: metal-dependent transcriptional regulator [Clostridiaceae bacterium]|nr:metal-dependent transcriptional regulator [Clostridiaceae bacterium]